MNLITTYDDLAELPVGAVVIDDNQVVAQRAGDSPFGLPRWLVAGANESRCHCQIALPVELLYTPDAP